MKLLFTATTQEQHTKGLQHHAPLRIDECAWFYFPKSGKYNLWNKDVSFPIAVIFCDEEHRIVDFLDMKANDKTIHLTTIPFKSAVEAHASAVQHYHLKKGMKLEILHGELHFI